MARTKSLNPTRRIETRITESLLSRVLSELYSSAEKCVPYGAWSRFVEQCIREHYQRRTEQMTPAPESRGVASGGQNPEVSVTSICANCGLQYITYLGCTCMRNEEVSSDES